MIGSAIGVYGAEEGVLEDEVEGVEGFVVEEVAQAEGGFWEGIRGLFLSAFYCGGSDVVADGIETGLCPRPYVMPEPAAGNDDLAAGLVATFFQPVHQAGRGFSLVPLDVALLVAFFPVAHLFKGRVS